MIPSRIVRGTDKGLYTDKKTGQVPSKRAAVSASVHRTLVDVRKSHGPGRGKQMERKKEELLAGTTFAIKFLCHPRDLGQHEDPFPK